MDFETFLREEGKRRPVDGAVAPPPTPQAPQIKPDGFESFLRTVQGEQQASTLQSAQAGVVANSQANTATAITAAPLARELGLPQAAVETDVPRFQQQARAQRNASLLESNPVLAQWVAANPDSARIAQDEFQNLSAVEKLWKFGGVPERVYDTLGGVWSSYNRAALGLNRSIQPWVRLLGGNAAGDWWGEAMIRPRREVEDALKLGVDAGFGAKTAHAVGQFLGLMSQVMLTGGTGGIALPASAGTMATMTAATQTAARSMAFPALTEATNRGQEVFEQTGDASAAYKAAASTYFFTVLQGIVPLSAPGNLAQRLTTGAVAGAVTSEAGRGVNNLLMPAELQQQFSAEEALFQAFTGALMGGVMGPRSQPNLYHAVRTTYTEALQAERAQVAIERVQKLGELTKDSALKKADPAAFRQFVDQVAERSDIDAVYIDPRTLGDALKQSDPGLLADLRPQIAEAAVTGADVRIPVADYATHIAGTPLEAALLPKLKASPDGMTYAEGQQHFQDLSTKLTAAAEKAAEKETQDTVAAAERDRVYQDVLGQLDRLKRFTPDVNRAYAALTRDFFTTLASRTGRSAGELFDEYALRIRGESPDGATLKQKRSPLEEAAITNRKRESILQSIADCLK